MQRNADLVRRGYEAFNTGDVNTLLELIREDAVFYQPGANAVSGDHRGRDAVLAYFGQLAQRSGGTFRADIEQLYASDRAVVVVHHATGESDGRALDTRTALIFTIENDQVTRFDAVQQDQDAFDAFFG
ncbi:MAG TPA: nuclear transport factor 2 family protein [Gaiellaceae bacterium]|jgi:hypothetical protein